MAFTSWKDLRGLSLNKDNRTSLPDAKEGRTRNDSRSSRHYYF